MRTKKNKKQKTSIVIQTTEEIVASAINSLSVDVEALSTEKNSALNVFRSTANNLANINEELQSKVNTINQLVGLATAEKDKASQMISDNEAVRKKILDIIGE